METETKQKPINLGRNDAKRLARRDWQYQRKSVVAAGKLHGVKTAKLKSYFSVFGY